MILTKDLVFRAIDLVRPSASAILKAEGTTWGPKYVIGFVDYPGSVPDQPVFFQFGNKPKRWKREWGERPDFAQIAVQKLAAAKRTKIPTSYIAALTPWLLKDGEYLYGGGTSWTDITVAISGAKSRVDEVLSEMVINSIVMLARLEADKRIAEGKFQI